MKRRANATLIGAFVVVALALIALAVVTVAGNQFFKHKERAVMHFSGSVYGLQVGAPVVFRGVRVGSVSSIDVFYDHADDSFSIPVVVELDGDAVRGLDGRRADREVGLALPALVERGLNAQLSMQSLLTGLLYVDLDLRPQREATTRGTYHDLIEIPTTATTIQALKDQFDKLDLGKITDDLAAIARSARALVAGPELRQALGDLSETLATVRRMSGRLDRRVDPLADELQKSLVTLRSAMERMGKAADGVDTTMGKFGGAADKVDALLAPESPLLAQVQRAADEVAQSAAALRQTASGESGLVRSSERALQDVSRAARALRDLAEMLEAHPEALLRGREVAQ